MPDRYFSTHPLSPIMGIMKRLTIAAVITCAAVLSGIHPLAAIEREIVLGGEAGWDKLRRTEGVRLGPSAGGTRALMLKDAEYSPQKDATDLLLHFNRTPIRDANGRYAVRSGYETRIASFSRMGTGAGSFDELAGGITLDPRQSALFSSAPWADFTVEFWLYPLRMENGETVLRWEGRRAVNGSIRLQNFECTVSGRRLQWNFDNFFLRPGGAPASLSLRGRTPLLPERWHHHLLRYDSRTGLLEYLVDGVPEAVTYATTTGKETGSVLRPYPGSRGDTPLKIGSAFSGFLDELRISEDYIEGPQLSRFPSTRGVAESELLDLEEADSPVNRIDVSYKTPKESELFFFYRTLDSYEQFLSSPPEWTRFIPGTQLEKSVKGRWIQLRVEFYSDGERERSPTVSRTAVRYEPNPPPGPPGQLEALPRDGAVVLRWRGVENPDLSGYLLYYGTASGNYRGRAAEEGASPIDVGNREEIRLTGLENGRLYYFALASYDTAGFEHHGRLSTEAHARPSRIYGAEE